MVSRENCVLYFDLWVWDESDEKVEKYGWSMIDIFDMRGCFLKGKYKVPFYPKEMKAHSLFTNGMKYLNHNCFCYVTVETCKVPFE